jgi:hypothetical protein
MVLLYFFSHRRTGFLIPCRCTPCCKLSGITESCHYLLNPVRATIKTSVHVSGASSDFSAIRTLSGTLLLLLFTYLLTWPVHKHSGDHYDFVKQKLSPSSLLLSLSIASALASVLGLTLATVPCSDPVLFLGEFWQPEVFSVRCSLTGERIFLYLNVPSLRSPVLPLRLVLQWRWLWSNCSMLLTGECRRTMIESSCSIVTFSTPNLKRHVMASNMGLSDKRPSISRLRYKKDFGIRTLSQIIEYNFFPTSQKTEFPSL